MNRRKAYRFSKTQSSSHAPILCRGSTASFVKREGLPAALPHDHFAAGEQTALVDSKGGCISRPPMARSGTICTLFRKATRTFVRVENLHVAGYTPERAMRPGFRTTYLRALRESSTRRVRLRFIR